MFLVIMYYMTMNIIDAFWTNGQQPVTTNKYEYEYLVIASDHLWLV